MLLAEFGTGQVFWSMLWFFLWFIWIWMLIVVFGDIFRSPDLSGWGKALWTIFVIVLPYLGVFVYLIARGRKMQEHAVQSAQAQDAAMREYVQNVAATSGGGAADELAKLADLRDQGDPQRGRVPTGQGQGAVLTDASGEVGRRRPASGDRAVSGRRPASRRRGRVWCSASSSSSGCSATRWSGSRRISSAGSTPSRSGWSTPSSSGHDCSQSSCSAGLLVWALYRRRWRMLGTVALAGAVAAGLVSLLESGDRLRSGTGARRARRRSRSADGSGFPSTAGIAAVAAVLTAAAPWLDRRARRAGWALMLGLMVTAFVDSPMSFDAMLAVAVGWLVGAAVLVAAGAPSRRPSLQAVIDGLAAVGVPLSQLDRAGVDARGSTPYFGVDTDGSQAVRQGARRRRAQRRSAVPPLPPPPAPRLRRPTSVRVVAAHRRARGVRRPRGAIVRGADAGPAGRRRRPSRTATSSPTRRSTGKSLDRVDPSDGDRRRARRDLAPRG